MSKRKIKIINDDNVKLALASYLITLSLINDDDDVVAYKKVPEGVEVTIEKEKDL